MWCVDCALLRCVCVWCVVVCCVFMCCAAVRRVVLYCVVYAVCCYGGCVMRCDWLSCVVVRCRAVCCVVSCCWCVVISLCCCCVLRDGGMPLGFYGVFYRDRGVLLYNLWCWVFARVYAGMCVVCCMIAHIDVCCLFGYVVCMCLCVLLRYIFFVFVCMHISV